MIRASACGLSPRVRGNHPRVHVDKERVRSIPACAGEPLASAQIMISLRVYPRVCGGTRLYRGRLVEREGLSPRVRGNPPLSPLSPLGPGSIPACAGEPLWKREHPRSWGVYPRVCGGTSAYPPSRSCTPGLSPRVRGNRYVHNTPRQSFRSIPACAGEPLALAPDPHVEPVYPRVCGGTAPLQVHSEPTDGLSPRVRGNPSRM